MHDYDAHEALCQTCMVQRSDFQVLVWVQYGYSVKMYKKYEKHISFTPIHVFK